MVLNPLSSCHRKEAKGHALYGLRTRRQIRPLPVFSRLRQEIIPIVTIVGHGYCPILQMREQSITPTRPCAIKPGIIGTLLPPARSR